MSAQRLAQLRAKHAQLVKDSDAILASTVDGDRELTQQETDALAKQSASRKNLETQMTIEEELLNTAKFGGDPTQFTAPTETRKEQKDPNNFGSFGEQLQAVIRASQPGARMDQRLVWSAGTGMNEQSATDGGFFVQKEFSSELLNLAFETGQLSRRVRRRPIGPGSNGLKMNAVVDYSRATGSRYGGIQCYWTEEGGLKTASAPKFRQMVLSLKKLVGLCYATDELLEDAVALQGIIEDAFKDEFGFNLDLAILSGTGSGQPLGVDKSPALIAQAAEGGQTADTINFTNIIKMYTRFFSRSKSSGNAIWGINNEVWPQLFALTVGGTSTVYGLPVFIPPGGINGAPYGSLMGIPIVELEQASAIGDQGDIGLYDFSQYLMIDKGGVNQQSSIHVRFIYDETTFRFVYRCDGQPIWNQPLTPYLGAATISPYVQLAAR